MQMECSGNVLKKRKNKRGKEQNELMLVSENLASSKWKKELLCAKLPENTSFC